MALIVAATVVVAALSALTVLPEHSGAFGEPMAFGPRRARVV